MLRPLCTNFLQRTGRCKAPVYLVARNFATPPDDEETWSKGGPAVQSPDAVGLQGRYAIALYGASSKANNLSSVEKDLKAVAALAERSEAFRFFLKDPTIPKKQKSTDLDAFLSDLKVTETTKSFFDVLIENNRLTEFSKINSVFETLLADARGQVTATITTAEPLDASSVEELKKDLRGVLDKGQTLLVNQVVDPAIIGGIIVDIGDKHLDLSILSRVKQLERLILAGPN
eukprot:jgi/Botrbrau1/9910/Bobra.0012s0011.1